MNICFQMPSTSPSNCTLPNVDKFSWQAVILIVSHVILFCFAAIGNIFMLLILHRNLRSNKGNRTFLLLLHMNVADLIVTFEYLPKQVIHMYTVWWYGGDLLCKMGRFFDIFGVSLSSAVLICMCFDRMLSVSRPFSTFYGIQRNKVMLGIAWITAFAISLPQLGIFLTASHPCDRSYVQCVARDYIGLLDTRYVLAYTFATAIYIYFLPLAVIIGCYTLIFYRLKISVRSQKNGFGSIKSHLEKTKTPRASSSHLMNLKRAKSKTLRMTMSIVLFFLACWTPYYAATTLHFIDIDYATGRSRKRIVIPVTLHKLLYMFATMNSSFNAYVYGYFSFDLRKELRRLVAFWLKRNDKDAMTRTSMACKYRTVNIDDLHSGLWKNGQHRSHSSAPTEC
uniref:G-protein coupled receptors family 1 profile domain-containing protein n=1 Tax=Ascaris lumbricoides TaxID=6252 RepID=A0A9J2PTU3_ASCLU